MKTRQVRYAFRKLRVRSKVYGTSERPRLSVYRSLKHIYAQLIDDTQGRTLASASSREKGAGKGAKSALAGQVGERLAKKAVAAGVKKVVFDRGARIYHGRVKAVADGARKGGLEF